MKTVDKLEAININFSHQLYTNIAGPKTNRTKRAKEIKPIPLKLIFTKRNYLEIHLYSKQALLEILSHTLTHIYIYTDI